MSVHAGQRTIMRGDEEARYGVYRQLSDFAMSAQALSGTPRCLEQSKTTFPSLAWTDAGGEQPNGTDRCEADCAHLGRHPAFGANCSGAEAAAGQIAFAE